MVKISLDERIRKLSVEIAKQQDAHFLVTGHKNFGLVESISSNDMTITFIIPCLDCQEKKPNLKQLVKNCEECVHYHESNDGCCHDCDPIMGTTPFCTLGKKGELLGDWIVLEDKVICEDFEEGLYNIDGK